MAFHRLRDFVDAPPQPDYWLEKERDGWKLVAIEWEQGERAAPKPIEEIPYGLKIADDCSALEEHPQEREVLMTVLESIVQDKNLSQIAEKLNDRGQRTRTGKLWTTATVFDLLPRVIESGARFLTTADWVERRNKILAAVR